MPLKARGPVIMNHRVHSVSTGPGPGPGPVVFISYKPHFTSVTKKIVIDVTARVG